MKKIFQLTMITLLTALLAGCGASAHKQVILEKLRGEDEIFQYDNLAWGSSKEQTEKTLGVKLDETITSTEEYQAYLAEGSFTWNNVKGDLLCEFDQNGLNTVTFLFQPNEADFEAFWSGLSEKLTSIYGDVEPKVVENAFLSTDLRTEAFTWDQEGSPHTVLSLSRYSSNGEQKYINISVYKLPEE